MKILQVSKLYYPWIGGIERIVENISEGLNGKSGFEIKVLCCQPQGKGGEGIINGVKVIKASSLGILRSMPLSLDFLRLFKNLSEEADIIDFHQPFPLGDLAFFLSKSGAKRNLIVHYHSDIVRQKILGFLAKPFIFDTLKKAKKIIVSNPNLIRNSPYLNKFKDRCLVIPFGVDLSEIERVFSEDTVRGIKEEYGDFVLFHGRLNYYKGVQYLIQAVKDVGVNLVIIGEGKEEWFLKQKAGEFNIENKVFFLPAQEREKLINFYKACKVFVLPSILKSEAFGIVLLEAMACAKPVISTELGTGTSFVNENGVTGFVVPPKDSSALSRAIKEILENEELARQFGRNALKKINEEFSLRRMLDMLSSAYQEIGS